MLDALLEALPVVCPLRATTGLDCPLCGASRATAALVRGDVVAALDHNALYVLALPVVVGLVLLWLVGGRVPQRLRAGLAPWAMAFVAAVFTIARNLPVEALAVLGSASGAQ